MEKKSKYGKQLRNYSHYSGMAFQMGIIIAGGTFGGTKLDKWLDTSPLFTIICSLASIAISMYLIIKDLSINQKKKK